MGKHQKKNFYALSATIDGIKDFQPKTDLWLINSFSSVHHFAKKNTNFIEFHLPTLLPNIASYFT